MKCFVISLSIFFLFVITVCSPTDSSCQEGAQTQVVETGGSAPVSGHDLARARSEAVREALQKAVAQVAGRWLTQEDATRKAPLLKEKIYDRADGFIQDYRIVSETTAWDIYTVAIRATVFADSIRSDLQGIGLIRQALLIPPSTRVLLTIRGIRDYREYAKCRGILKERMPGIREVTPREVSWNMARFDIAAEGTLPAVAERLRAALAVEILHQDERVLEVNLR